jgi:hypothetical protein
MVCLFNYHDYQGLRPTIPKNTNPRLAELLERCWQQDAAQRPDFFEIIEVLQRIADEVNIYNLSQSL